MDDSLEKVERTLSALKNTVDERSEQVDQRFEQVDQRFAQIDQRFAQVDLRFEQVDQRFERMERLILSEGERTRRHFDVVAEQMKAERNLVLDLGLASAERVARLYAANVTDRATIEATLRDHDVRLRELEQRADSA